MKVDFQGMVAASRSAIARGWDRTKAAARGMARGMTPALRTIARRLEHAAKAAKPVLRQVPQRLRLACRSLPGVLRGVQRRLASAARVVAGIRLAPRTWTVLMALVAVPLGAFLLVGPLRELATGRSLGPRSLLTLCWLVTGAATLAAGIGILLRARPYRKLLVVAFACSLPLPVAFAYRTIALAVKMRSSTGSTQARIEPFVSGGVQLSLFFIAVSVFLLFLLRFRHLRALQCSPSVLQGRAGPYVGAGIGAAAGTACGYLVWLLSRFLGYELDIQVLRDVVDVFQIEYFAVTGAVLGAIVFLVKWQRSRARGQRSAAPTMP